MGRLLESIIAGTALSSFIAASTPTFAQSRSPEQYSEIDCNAILAQRGAGKDHYEGVLFFLDGVPYCANQFGLEYDIKGAAILDVNILRRMNESPVVQAAEREAKLRKFKKNLKRRQEAIARGENPPAEPDPRVLEPGYFSRGSSGERYTSSDPTVSKKDPSDNLVGGITLALGLAATTIGAVAIATEEKRDCEDVGYTTGESCQKKRWLNPLVLGVGIGLDALGIYFIARDR